jgi:hypothetical protein
MRRVYYAFALNLATHPIILTGTALLLSVYVLSVFIHVASIVHNFLSIPVARIPQFVANAFLSTDILTLICVCLVGVCLVGFNRSVARLLFTSRRYQVA